MNKDLALGKEFWEYKYRNESTDWDMGEVSPPIKAYIDQLENKDLRILIPGAGFAHEAEYLLEKGFTQITVIDISSILIAHLKEKFKGNDRITLIEGDFFEHKGEYDLIIEQTFFCTLYPKHRPRYVQKVKELMAEGGKLVGLLFDRDFDSGPPFGGFKKDYIELFEGHFKLKTIERCYNSHPARMGNELWINLEK